MNREELQKVHDALSLLNSMVNCGDQHSPTSVNMTQAAFAILRKPLPPAEDAEQRIRVRNILQDFYRRGEYELEQAEEDIMRLFQPQPTAEGAEAFLDEMELGEPLQTGEFYYRSEVLEAMNKFATLHAQRIADKMVSERLIDELVKCLNWVDKSTYWKEDNDIPTTLIVDEYLHNRNK